MRCWLDLALAALLICAGCAKTVSSPSQAAGARTGPAALASEAGAPGQRPIVTPDSRLVGKVVMVNPTLRFVVLNFPVGQLPLLEQRLIVYRHGLKVGEVKVSGPHRDDNTVADILTGEAGVGDEVRDR